MVIPDSESGMIFVDAAFQWESKIELGVWKWIYLLNTAPVETTGHVLPVWKLN